MRPCPWHGPARRMRRRPGLGSVFGCELRRVLCLVGTLVCFLWLVLFVLYAAVPEGDARPHALRGRRSPEIASAMSETLRGQEEKEERARQPESPAPLPEASSVQELAVPEKVRVRGLADALQERFAALRAQGRFECMTGDKSFASFSVVNDDYCDCADGSDEPGTSACSGIPQPVLSGFACTWSGGASPERLVRLGSVNDGICDCCNGQDEWSGVVSCQDRCSEEAAEAAREATRAEEGSRAREVYAQRAASLRSMSRFKGKDGGPDGVYFAAAEAGCLKLSDGDFEFEVCLFDRVTQRDLKSGNKFTLGKDSAWATTLWENGQHRTDYTKLVMSHGDYCAPAKKGREAEISFECAVKPALLSVQEGQVCIYAIRMQTPAACHPLAHREA